MFTLPVSQLETHLDVQTIVTCSPPVRVVIVTCPVAGNPDWVDDCSLPLTVTLPLALLAAAPGLGSSTCTNLPNASEQVRRCLPASSVLTVQSPRVLPPGMR